MDVKKINFKDKKYVFPAILYPIILFVGYFVIDMVNTDVSDSDPRLRTTDYLNTDLPEANTDSVLGDKLNNVEREFGQIDDLSGVGEVGDDRDSINKKEGYESQYSQQEAEAIRRQQEQARQEEQRKIHKMQQRVRQGNGNSNRNSSNDNFVSPVSDSEIERYETMRRQRVMAQMNDDLRGFREGASPHGGNNGSGSTYAGYDDGDDLPTVGVGNNSNSNHSNGSNGGLSKVPSPYKNHDGESKTAGEVEKVVKKIKSSSDYFNTISSSSASESKLIKAVIDENVKAQEGSRVRLRLLDDVEIGDKTVKKGTYLYAYVSGFGQQRVKGNIQSIFFQEEIFPVSLSIYDTDGQEGLYVPQSAFRETTKEVLGSATQGGTNIVDNNTTSTGIKGWASQAVQNASQQVMNAVNKVVRRNRVKLKYGTLVYLIDGSQQENRPVR